MPGKMCHDVLSDTYLLLHICRGKEQGCPAHMMVVVVFIKSSTERNKQIDVQSAADLHYDNDDGG